MQHLIVNPPIIDKKKIGAGRKIMKELKSIQTNPFQKSGKLKKKNFLNKNGEIFTKHNFPDGQKTVPVYKETGEQWTKNDRPDHFGVSGFDQEQILQKITTLHLKKLLRACDLLKVKKWGKTKDGKKTFKCNSDQLVSRLKKAYIREKASYKKTKFEETVMGGKKSEV
jgi:hypothetical protein